MTLSQYVSPRFQIPKVIQTVFTALSLTASLFLIASVRADAQFTKVEAETYTASAGIQTEDTDDVGGGLNVGFINTGEWAEYTIDVPTAGSYKMEFRVASNSVGGTLNILAGGVAAGSATVVNTGGWQTWETISTTVDFSSAGSQTLRFDFTGDSGISLFNYNWFTFVQGPILTEAEDFTAMNNIVIEAGNGATTDSIGYIYNGSWAEYSVTIPFAGDYQITFSAASNNDGGNVDVVVGGATLGTATIPKTSGWSNWTDFSTNVTFASAGTQTVRLNFVDATNTGALYNMDSFTITVAPEPLSLVIGNTEQQKMRYGMDYERLWYWGSLSSSGEREVAQWSAVDTDIDFVRVAMNSSYELTENVFNLSAYTSKIIPMMQRMQEANPNIKFFASPRPLNESHSTIGIDKDNISWQPYPLWITDPGETSYSNTSYNFSDIKCAEYMVKYLLLMKSYGFKINFMDATNEWQNSAGGRITQGDLRDIHEYLNVTYLADRWGHPGLGGYDLDFVSVPAVGDLPTSGESLVVVALVNNTDLNIQIFDASGTEVLDKAEATLISGQDLTDLKLLLNENPFPDTSGWSSEERQEIIDKATTISGHTALSSMLLLNADDIPTIVAPSAHNYQEGTWWVDDSLNTQEKKDAVEIAACHNTGRNGTAKEFADTVATYCNPGTEIWNTEVHGWKSTSSENETTSFYYYLETIRAGFGGINGWLAIGTTNQGHSYILNPSGTPTRNVKYHIFQKLSSTSNYGHALDIIEEPGVDVLNAPLDSNDDIIDGRAYRNVAAFIKGNLMTIWVINENATSVPLEISPFGKTIGTSTIRQTRWTDPSDVEGFQSLIPVISNTEFNAVIPGESVVCFEITLNTETFANETYDAKDFSHSSGIYIEENAYENVAGIDNGYWTRYGSVALDEDSTITFGVARPGGRPDGIIRVREGSADGNILGEVSVPETGNWQNYQSIQTQLDVEAGIYNLYLEFVEDAETPTGNAMFNLDWFEVNVSTTAAPVTGLAATTAGATQIDLTWDSGSGADTYNLKRSNNTGGPYATIASGLTGFSDPDTGLSSGQEYFYVISGVLGGSEGPDSAEVSAFTLPAAPTNVQAVATGETTITFSWDASVGAYYYAVYRSTTMGDGTPDYLGNVPSVSPSFNDTSLTAGTRYYYVAEAVGGGGASLRSDEADAMPFQAIVPENRLVSSFVLGDDGFSNDQVTFSIQQTGLGQNYQVQERESLETGTWTPIGAIYQGTGGLLDLEVLFDHSAPANEQHFFRVNVWTE